MSMTLILWKAPIVRGPEEAEALLEPWYERSDDSAFVPSDDIAKASAELLRRYPNDGGADRPDEEPSPWADFPFEQTDRILVLTISWSADDSVLHRIEKLARNYELVLYDPQGPDIHLPSDPMERAGPDPKPTVLDILKTIPFVVAGMAVTYIGWRLQIPVLRWVVMLAGGFFTIAAAIVVFAVIGARDDER